MIALLVALAIFAAGLLIAARALWRLDEPVMQFVAGMAIAIVGLFAFLGQVWRLTT